MTTNRRYAESTDRRMDQRILDTLMRDHAPESLTDLELELATEPLTRAPHARPVKVWVRYGPTPVLVDAEAVAWTDHAIAVRWTTPAGGEHRAWVWASAVRRA